MGVNRCGITATTELSSSWSSFSTTEKGKGKKYQISIFLFPLLGSSAPRGKRRHRLQIHWPALPGAGDGADDSREGRGKATCARGRNVCKPKKSHVRAGSVLWPGAPAASGSERLRLQARSLGTGKKEAAGASVHASSRGELAPLSHRDGFNCDRFDCNKFKRRGFKCKCSNCNARRGFEEAWGL